MHIYIDKEALHELWKNRSKVQDTKVHYPNLELPYQEIYANYSLNK